MPDSKALSAQYKQDKAIFKKVLTTQDGQQFLEALKRRFGHPRVSQDPAKTAEALGQFYVLDYLTHVIAHDDDD